MVTYTNSELNVIQIGDITSSDVSKIKKKSRKRSRTKLTKTGLCFVDRASLYNLVNKTNLVNNLFLVYLSIPICFGRLWAVWYAGWSETLPCMILAGVLLKLGGYGLLRVFPVLFKFGFRFGVVWVALRLVGGLFVNLFCIRQTDLKSLIAYSSVAHMSIVTGGFVDLLL